MFGHTGLRNLRGWWKLDQMKLKVLILEIQELLKGGSLSLVERSGCRLPPVCIKGTREVNLDESEQQCHVCQSMSLLVINRVSQDVAVGSGILNECNLQVCHCVDHVGAGE